MTSYAECVCSQRPASSALQGDQTRYVFSYYICSIDLQLRTTTFAQAATCCTTDVCFCTRAFMMTVRQMLQIR